MELEGLDLLSEQECRWLLGQARVGRVAVSLGEVPAVFPVNYMVAGEEILFFTAEGTKLRAAAANATVTFEADHIDAFAETGWSVLVVGTARERTEPAVIVAAKRLGLQPWAAGDRFHLIAVSMDFISGRRIEKVVDLRGARSPHGREPVGPRSHIGALARPPVRVGMDWSLQAVADVFGEAKVSAVIVGADRTVVTERDLTRALNAGLGPDDRVGSIRATDLVYVDDDATVIQAAIDMLRNEIRHLLVRNWRGEVTGVVTLRDVLAVLVDAMDPAVWVLIRRNLSVTAEIRSG
jgi:CBS domain-containing protein